jgi:hypothetical protein
MPVTTAQTAVMPVLVRTDDNIKCLGTAFTVSNLGVMITAWHVVKDANELRHPDEPLYVHYVASGAGYDLGPEGEIADLLPITRVSYRPEFDLAVLQVLLGEVNGKPIRFPAHKISPACPPVGERVLTLGYSRFDSHRSESDKSDQLAYEAQQNFSASGGEVTDVHPTGRDRVMLPFPSFETDCRYDGGMSGGPVIASSNGAVCGVVCSGIALSDDYEGHTSYASAIAPALALDVLVKTEEGEEKVVTLLEMARSGHLAADEWLSQVRLEGDNFSYPSRP